MAPLDQTAVAGSELRMSREFSASRERVFAAWTQASALGRWLCPQGFTIPSVAADVRVGGRYRIEMRGPDGSSHRVGGEFREVRPPDRLVFTWAWETGNELAGVETEVTVELKEHGGKTLLNMIHRGLPSEAARRSHADGWGGAFANLDAMLRLNDAQRADD